MKWNAKFARRTAAMKRSTVRELLKIIARPGMISFAGGLPAPELFPVEAVRAASDKVLSTLGSRCLQYSESEGITGLRDYIAAAHSRSGFKVGRQNVVIVNGSQQALDLIGRVLLDENDLVLVENPTYLALLSAWRPLGVQFEAIPSDANGLRTDSLSASLERQPKAMYVIPNYQNPQGTCLSLERRERLAVLLRRTSQVLIEDNPYGELRYEGDPLPHLFELNARMYDNGALDSQVVYTSTFSKVLAPGLRLGFVIGAAEIVDKIVQAKQSADLHTSTFSQYLVLELVQSGLLEEQIPRLRQAYGTRRDVMLEALQKHFPSGVKWTRPNGGMFLMATLPSNVEASKVLQKALEQNVAFVPGEDFHLDGQGRNTFRLNFSYNPPEVIEEGVRRLGAVLAREITTVTRKSEG